MRSKQFLLNESPQYRPSLALHCVQEHHAVGSVPVLIVRHYTALDWCYCQSRRIKTALGTGLSHCATELIQSLCEGSSCFYVALSSVAYRGNGKQSKCLCIYRVARGAHVTVTCYNLGLSAACMYFPCVGSFYRLQFALYRRDSASIHVPVPTSPLAAKFLAK